MCGIICRSGLSVSTENFLNSLKRIEYRGYDSIGVSLIADNTFQVLKSLNSVDLFIDEAKQNLAPTFKVGIGHTRWATHGVANIENAHPIIVNDIAIVHNGIIANIEKLKEAFNFTYNTQTDTEFIARYLDFQLKNKVSLKEAIFRLMNLIDGESAFIAISKRFNGFSIAVAKESSLVFSINNDEILLGSDIISILPVKRYHRLDNSILFFKNGIFNNEPILESYSIAKKRLTINWKTTSNSLEDRALGNYSSYFEKEVNEQPFLMKRTIQSFSRKKEEAISLFQKSNSIILYASGSAYNAALWASYFYRETGKNAIAVPASEINSYSKIPFDLSIAISQSGETMDTIRAAKILKSKNSISIINRSESSLAQLTQLNLELDVKEEVSVASSKTFMGQILMSYLLGGGSLESSRKAIKYLEKTIESKLPEDLMKAKLYLFVGRNSTYPIALEGALKLKELSYIPSDGLASGELKHGPISLIDKSVVVIALEPIEESERFRSILQEVSARGGRILELKKMLELNSDTEISRAMTYTVLIQKLARECAESLGRDVDKPRNLAKSVTVA